MAGILDILGSIFGRRPELPPGQIRPSLGIPPPEGIDDPGAAETREKRLELQQRFREYMASLEQDTDTRKFLWENEYHPKFSKSFHIPSPTSGLTVGAGYDTKKRQAGQVYADLIDAGAKEDTARAIADGAGLRGKKARAYADANAGRVSLTQEQIMKLFDIDVPRHEARLEKNLKAAGYDLKKLSPQQRALYLDYEVNTGNVLKEFPEFSKALGSNDFEKALKQYKRFTKNKEGQWVPLGQRNARTEEYLKAMLAKSKK